MNDIESKGRSPFYPDQPVPFELFRGRAEQIDHILERGVGQVAAGKPVAMFIEGEYGIGKTSIAKCTQWLAESKHNLHGIYASLGGVRNLDDVAEQILKATVHSGAFQPTRAEKIQDFLGKYVEGPQLFGLKLNLAALKQDAPSLRSPSDLLQLLGETRARLADTGVQGIFLILDEINGICADPQFAHLLKGIVDSNAVSHEPVPLLLMLCGVEERRRELIRQHEPVARIFDTVQIERMTKAEMREFYLDSFATVNMEVQETALEFLVYHAAGFPKIMHLIGNAAYWVVKGSVIDKDVAMKAVLQAAQKVGSQYVTQQVYAELESEDYRSILAKIARMGPNEMSFSKEEVSKGLTVVEKRKFGNFLQRMRKLNVIRSGGVRGEYVFNVRMVRLFIWLDRLEESGKARK